MSLFIYTILLFWPFLLLSLLRKKSVNYRFLIYILAFFPTALLASLRGNTGTDTEYYRELFNDLDNEFGFLDPLFWYPQYLIKTLGFGFQFFTFTLSFGVLYLFCRGFSRIERDYPYVSASVLPVLFIDATFNGLRYGFSFALAAYAIGTIDKRSDAGSRASLLIPALAHSSMLPLAFIKLRLSFFNLILTLIFLYIIYNIAPIEYLLNKSDLYSTLERPTSFSGLMPLIQFIGFFFIKRKYCQNSELSLSIEKIATILFLLSILISTFSYAGLRILQISTYLLAISIPTSSFISHRKTSYFIAALIGIMTSLNFLRQIITSDGVSVRFLPYEFFF